MRAPWHWLKEYFPTEVPPVEAAAALTMAGVAVENIIEEEGETILELELTPNLAHCLSLSGLAGELAAILGGARCLPPEEPLPADLPAFPVEVAEGEFCPRYAAVAVDGIQVVPSPEWMQARLRAAGVRPICNVVDVTNYVMLELGQPLHAFDREKLGGDRIGVRLSRAGEKLITLDGVARDLPAGLLLITDAGVPVALAGVMGGEESGVTGKTRSIILESAFFAPGAVRRTVRTIGLYSDASHRFERGVDPAGQVRALARAVALLRECGVTGRVVGTADVRSLPPAHREIIFRPGRVNALLGTDLAPGRMAEILTSLGMVVKKENKDEWLVTAPTNRPDLSLEVDLAEEVARLHGYDKIPVTLPARSAALGRLTPRQKGRRAARAALAGAGLREVLTFSLLGEKFLARVDLAGLPVVSLANPLVEEESVLRPSLVPSLLAVLATNAARKVNDVAVFEVAPVFPPADGVGGAPAREEERIGLAIMGDFPRGDWHRRGEKASFFTLKGLVEELLAAFGLEGEYLPAAERPFSAVARVLLEGEEVGVLGQVDPTVWAELDLRGPAYLAELALAPILARTKAPAYRPLPRFPAVERDVAAVFPREVPATRVAAAIRVAAGEILESLSLFDVYSGPQVSSGRRSLAYALVYRSDEGTLTDAQADEAQARVRAALEEMGGRLRA